jgi:serine phosphatase RsbU (regulator of sigma subunit)
MQSTASRIDLRVLLDRVEAASPVEAVDVLTDELARMLHADSVVFWIADLGGRSLCRIGGSGTNAARDWQDGAENVCTTPVPGSRYEPVLRDRRVDVCGANGGGALLSVPVSDRGDAIGVIDLHLARQPDAETIAEIATVGHVLAHVVIACRRHTDLFEWAQRTKRFNLAAEIQRRLLPSALTCETAQFTLSGWLEPAEAVGGDTFDFTLARDTLHLSITDAVGNDVNAAQLATVLVGSLRNGRRHGLDLLTEAGTANDALSAHSPVGEFVTGQVARVDLQSGVVSLVNAGHPFPLRLRDGAVEEIELDIDIPFGLEPGRAFRAQQIALRPGDRIAFLTDGMLERNLTRDDVEAVLLRTAHLHPREVVVALGDEALHATGGGLRDDATVLCLDWHGGPPQRRG